MEPYQQLETKWAEFNRLDPAGMVACSSGTAALHMALEALRLPPGSKVIVPDFGMIACPRAVTLAGLTPVFVDCENDLLMSETTTEKITTDRDIDDSKRCLARPINAIMPVHIYGQRCNMDWFADAADDWNMDLIEDLAEAHGVCPHDSSDAACWSFYQNKIIAGQEGGAVWFRNPAHAVLARQLRSLGFTDAHDFRHIPRGHNYRMSNAHAELVLKSLAAYPENVKRRWELWERCNAACPPEWRFPRPDAPWVFPFRVPGMTAAQQNAVVVALQAMGVGARHAFKPMHAQEEYRHCRRVGGEEAERASRGVIYLPLTPGLDYDAKACFDLILSNVG